MANLWLTEYTSLAKAGAANTVPAGDEPSTVVQNISFTTATQSVAFRRTTRFVRVYSSVACHVAFGENPTATADSTPLAAKSGEYFGVKLNHKISVYDGTS
jgi:hypothetical protein